MSTFVVRLDEVPVRERFDYWWEAVAQSVVSVDASSDHAANFWAEMRAVDLGVAQVSRVRCATFEARRSMSRIRHSDPGMYQLSLTLRGLSGIRQEDREAILTPTDLTLYDTSRTFHARSSAGVSVNGNGARDAMSEGVIVQFPHEALAFPVVMVRPLLARRLSGENGVGALLGGLLRQLVAQAERLPSAHFGRLSDIVLDLITTLLAHELETDPTSALRDPGRVLLLRIQDFIEQRLTETDLSPAVIAAAHHISLRHLHRLFQQHGLTVGTWIRQRRLVRCHRALADPRMDDLPINAIAARWGFSNDAHFSRAFRSAYGVPPATYRRHLREGRHQEIPVRSGNIQMKWPVRSQ
jgi:AraC-like DNA-binding protein